MTKKIIILLSVSNNIVFLHQINETVTQMKGYTSFCFYYYYFTLS